MAPRKKNPTPPRKAAKPPVLNLKATEVKSAADRQADKTKAASSAKPAVKPTVKPAEKPAIKPKPAEATKPASSTSSAKSTGSADKKPAQKTNARTTGTQTAAAKKSSGKTVFVVAGLAALVAAGLGGAWAFNAYGVKYFGNSSGGNGVSVEQLAGVTARIDKLESGTATRTGQTDEIKALVAGLQQKISQTSAELNANTDKLATLEATAAEIRTALAKAVENGQGPADAANKLQFQALSQKITEMEKALADLKNTPVKDNSDIVDNLKARVDALVLRLKAAEEQTTATTGLVNDVKAAQEKLASGPVANPASELAKAFTILRAKISQGVSFEAALDVVAAQLPQETLLDILRPFAKTGAPTLASLKKALVDVVVSGSEQAEQNPQNSDGGMFGAITNRLSGLVKVSKVGETDWEALKKQALQALDEGQVGKAVNALKDKAGAPDGIKQWLQLADSKTRVDQALKGLTATIMAQLTAGSE